MLDSLELRQNGNFLGIGYNNKNKLFNNGSQEGKGREEGVIRMMRAMGPGDWIIITPQHLQLYLPNEPYLPL